MQIVTIGNDLEDIEPTKSFWNAEDSVPYGALKENDKLIFEFPSLTEYFCKNYAEKVAFFFKKFLTFGNCHAKICKPHRRGLSWCAKKHPPLERDYTT